MRLFVVFSLLLAASAIRLPSIPDDAMLTPPEDTEHSEDIGEGDQKPPEPAKPEAWEDPNQTPDDEPDADQMSMIQGEGDESNLLQVDPAPAPAAGAPAPAAGAPAPAAGAPAPAPGGDKVTDPSKPAGAGAGAEPAATDSNNKPAGTNGPPAGDTGATAEPAAPPDSGAGNDAGNADQGDADQAEKPKGPIGRLTEAIEINRPKEVADPLYSSGTKINKNNKKIYKKIDYSPAKATERAVLTQAKEIINKARSKHREFLEDTKEEIEKMLDA